MNFRVPLADLKAQFAAVRRPIEAAIQRVVESQVFVSGPEVEAFEREMASLLATKFAIGVGSGTDALLVCLMALGIGPGDEVLTTSYSFISTASCVARLGATPRFVDIEPATFNLDITRLDALVTSRTKAIIPVHLFGQMAEMEAICSFAARHGIAVVEDAAQAVGARRGGKHATSQGTLGCLSFFPSKNLGAFGDAGMVLTNDENLAAHVRSLRNHGQAPKYVARDLGGNFRMDEIQGAVLRAKLPYLAGWIDARRMNARAYQRLFREAGLVGEAQGESDKVVLPPEASDAHHVYSQFVIRVPGRRDALRAFLAERGVASEVYYPRPMHLHPCFAKCGQRIGDYPEAERAAHDSLAIPIYPELTRAMQELVVSRIADFFASQ